MKNAIEIDGTAGFPPAMSAKREWVFVKDTEGCRKLQEDRLATMAGGTPAVPVAPRYCRGSSPGW